MKFDPSTLRNWLLLGVTIFTILGAIFTYLHKIDRMEEDLRKHDERSRYNYGMIEDLEEDVKELEIKTAVLEARQ